MYNYSLGERIKLGLGMEVAIPWSRFFNREPDDYRIYEINPTPSVRNNQAYLLAKVVASFYQKPKELYSLFTGGAVLTVRSPYRFNFRVVMKEKDVAFYILVPTAKESEILRKVEGLYDSGITITRVSALPGMDAARTFCTELTYAKNDIFSLSTDRDNNYPLPSLLTTVRTLQGDDIAIFDAMLEPANRMEWYAEARATHKLLERGYVPDNSTGGRILRAIDQAFNAIRNEVLEFTRFTQGQQDYFNTWKREQSTVREARRIRQEMSSATKRKQDDDVLKAWLRVAVQSNDQGRARGAAYTIANAWKDLNADNELTRADVPPRLTPWYLSALEGRRPASIRLRPIKVSPEEAGKFLQLPGDSLIAEYPEIRARKLREVRVPDELTQSVKGVRIGWVTERGTRSLVKIPLEEYPGVQRRAVYDALCTASFGQGKQGTGKSDGYGLTWAYDFIIQGFSAIVVDTADGQVLRNLLNCLPADFPDEKIHALNLDNKAYPIGLNWSDVYGRTFAGGDQELQALEIAERITGRFVDFINSLSNTGEFTDRMAQYVTSCMRAITTAPVWSFLDLELALTSPAYREELIGRQAVRAMPDVVIDLMNLQEKAEDGKAGSITDPIISRIRTLSSTQFMTNLFYQDPLLDNGRPVLDFRRLMDNAEGGYGHIVVIQASGDAWQGYQATILGFMLDKIIFNAFSRIDVDQDQRRPCLIWIDEPHKVIKTMEGRLAGTSVEFRKYRVKNLFTGHSIDQMGQAANALMDGGAQVTSYKTERLSELERFAHLFAPYDDAKALYESLPEKWRAVNAVRLPSGRSCPAFIADMVPPPGFVKDRGYVWDQGAKKYGLPWKTVRDKINSKRQRYMEADSAWYEARKEEAARRKAEQKTAKNA